MADLGSWIRRLPTDLTGGRRFVFLAPGSLKPARSLIPRRSRASTQFLFVLLSSVTSEAKYLASAEYAGDFVWNAGQENESFVGGTIDNPDVLDKEAGTVSLEAYLALYGHIFSKVA